MPRTRLSLGDLKSSPSLRSPWASLFHQLAVSHQILLILFPKYLLICPVPLRLLSLLSISLVTSHSDYCYRRLYGLPVTTLLPSLVHPSKQLLGESFLRHKSGHSAFLLKTLPQCPSLTAEAADFNVYRGQDDKWATRQPVRSSEDSGELETTSLIRGGMLTAHVTGM